MAKRKQVRDAALLVLRHRRDSTRHQAAADRLQEAMDERHPKLLDKTGASKASEQESLRELLDALGDTGLEHEYIVVLLSSTRAALITYFSDDPEGQALIECPVIDARPKPNAR